MREYIDKQKLLMALNDKYHDMSAMPASYYAGFKCAIKLIERLHVSEEVAPVVHAKWMGCENKIGTYQCSNCGIYIWGPESHYCSYCGAKCDLEDETDDR